MSDAMKLAMTYDIECPACGEKVCIEPDCTHEVPCLAVHAERGTLKHDDDGEHVVHMRD